MRIFKSLRGRAIPLSLVGLGLVVLGIASCSYPERRGPNKTVKSQIGWNMGSPQQALRWREAEFPILKVSLEQIPDAELVDDDSLCATCHEKYVEIFKTNVHRKQKCESCHGPASRHVATRGEPGLIFSFKKMPVEQRSEVCLKCHEDSHGPGEIWRTSVHAHNGLACTDCHKGHYNVPPGTPAVEIGSTASGASDLAFVDSQKQAQEQNAAGPEEYASLVSSISSETTPASGTGIRLSQAIVRGQEPTTEISLKGTSNFMGAVAPDICYRCHCDKRDLEQVAHPHQVCGKNNFNCTTCHDPHGKILHYTRKDLCLSCHQDAPTMAWHSSIHDQYSVFCTDCHNPHPRSKVPEIVGMSHTSVDRPKRMPMSVDEPEACYKCHPQIYAQNAMPSHHPIKEGKMVCSDCHDPHGQARGNLREAGTVNQVCYRCHADKQGPFAYEHPPVTEDCSICHNPHGTVANNLLKQPPNFLCLRCHTGHRTSPLGPNHDPLLGDVGKSASLQKAFYRDCTGCHSQIHGSDLPTPRISHGFMR